MRGRLHDVEGKVMAHRYPEHERATQVRAYSARKAAGLCVECGRQARPGLTLCARCAEGSRKRIKRRRRTQKEKGYCALCGCRPRLSGKTMCVGCREKDRLRAQSKWKARIAAGLCGACGGVKEEAEEFACLQCQAKSAMRNRRSSCYKGLALAVVIDLLTGRKALRKVQAICRPRKKP
jgi:hypothetical protein